MTALVSLSAGGAITGFSFVPKAAADISSPASMPLNLVALRQSGHSARPAPGTDAMLRMAIVNVADYYRRMAQNKTPAEMEAIIWQHDSIDGADHGQSCAAFASLTLELAAQVVGQQSWVSGGSSYPWPLHSWADVRVDPNPDSLGIVSIQQDAQAQHRWHPLGDGYLPRPGDWVLFDGHVEVVTEDSGGVLHTVGGDSLPNFSVNAHEYGAPLSSAGVVGFVNNGSVPGANGAGGQGATSSDGQSTSASGGQGAGSSGGQGAGSSGGQGTTSSDGSGPRADAGRGTAGGLAAIPGTSAAGAQEAGTGRAVGRGAGSVAAKNRRSAHSAPGDAAIPGLAVPAPRSGAAAEKSAEKAADRTSAPRVTRVARGDASIPGLDVAADLTPSHQGAAYRRHHPSPARKPVSETRVQQAFIREIASGAIAAQHRYGVPAAVTIAQAIDESGWGQSQLAAQDHNLFGIKGSGPAGSVPMPTQEYVNGQPVSTSASFRVYHNAAESIDDHGRLLARSGYYQQAMTERQHPDKFAAALTGVYATDPNYGANLISLMRRYDLYRYSNSDARRPDHRPAVAEPGSADIPGVPGAVSAPAQPRASASPPPATPQPTRTAAPEPTRTVSPQPTGTAAPEPTRTVSPQPTGTASPVPTRTVSPLPTGTAGPGPRRTAAPEPTATGSSHPAGAPQPEPSTTGGPNAAGPSTPPSPATPRAADPGSPSRTPARSRRVTPAARPSPSGARPSVAPSAAPSQADIPGVSTQYESDRPMTSAVSFGPGARFVPVARSGSARSAQAPARPAQAPARSAPAAPRAAKGRSGVAPVRATLVSARRYQAHMPRSVLNSFVQTAKGPLLSEETLYRDVASFRGISWQLLAACDWMQCDARPRRSPVSGERLGSLNADGTVYTSKSAALARCADDLIRLARAVYGIDLTGHRDLSVRDLANAFAAFRWGGLLKTHDCSAMEFPYSVAGLTDHHLGMRWPRITVPGTGDRPGSRYRRPFGAVPIVLGLDYPATV